MVREMEDKEIRGAVIKFRPESGGTRLEHQISRIASLFLELLKRMDRGGVQDTRKDFIELRDGGSPRALLKYLALFEHHERAQA